MPNHPDIVRFGAFEVDLTAGEVRKAGMRQKLAGQPFQVLQILLQHPREIVTRAELRQRLWPENTFVDHDLALKKAVNRLREVLGDSADSPRFIETIPRHGYRFIAALQQQLPDSPVSNAANSAKQPMPAQSSPPVLWQRMAIGVAVVLALAALAWAAGTIGRYRARASTAHPSIRSIAVLPLENLSKDPSQDYFSDGITDALTTELAQIGSLRVISRTSAEHFKGTRDTLPEIGRKLNVDAIVEGSVTRSENRVRISAQLIDAPSDRHVWAKSYERDLKDVLVLQDEVARDIAEEIRIKLTPEERTRMAVARSIDPAAHEAYLKGNYYFAKMSTPGFQEGLRFYQQAVTREPNYGQAYVGMAECYEKLGMWGGLPPREASPQAKAAAEKALAIDDSLGEAHATLGHIHFTYDWDWLEAEHEFARALELTPSSSMIRVQYSTYLSAMGRHSEALAQIKEAYALDPVSPITNGLLGSVYFWAHRFDEAISQYQQTLVLYPDSAVAHRYLGLSYEQKGMYGEAVEEYVKENELYGVRKEELAVFRQAFASSGMMGFLRTKLKLTVARSKRQHVSPSELADLYARLGENDQAFEWLEKARQEREHGIAFIKVEPTFDGLHSDPRFHDLLRRLGLPE